AGDHLDPLHRAVHHRAVAQHAARPAGDGRVRQRDGQPEPGARGGGVHRVVHHRVHAALPLLAQQVEVLQGCPERDRPSGHPALLHHHLPHRVQPQRAAVPERPPRRPDLPHHEDPEDPEAGPPLDGPPVAGIHAPPQLQRAGPPHPLPRHGHHDLLQPRLLRRERRRRHQVPQHPRLLLVGHHHHDHGGLRRHLPADAARQDRGRPVLHRGRARHRAAHPHHRQQLQRVLQGAEATGEGGEAARGARARQAQRQHRVDELARRLPAGRRPLRRARGPRRALAGQVAVAEAHHVGDELRQVLRRRRAPRQPRRGKPQQQRRERRRRRRHRRPAQSRRAEAERRLQRD
ncbi:unnamed protein product, partial [Lampetra fluviatilis]